MNEVAISAITWFEFLRGARRGHEDQDKVRALTAKLRILSLDPPMAAKADALMHARELRESICYVCLAGDKDKVCTKCGRKGAAVQRLNDALIVATAELTSDVTTLYSFDGGVLAYGEVVSSCTITKPQSQHGPLFDGLLELGAGEASAQPVQPPRNSDE
jgi:predicted nucleic acid-binding protein